jgi:hypothetical protein
MAMLAEVAHKVNMQQPVDHASCDQHEEFTCAVNNSSCLSGLHSILTWHCCPS